MEKNHIIYVAPVSQNYDVIDFEKIEKRRVQRRRRVSKRMMKRFPLFAAEFMRPEFSDITDEVIIFDVTRKTRKSKSRRKSKSPLQRQGRFPLMQKALSKFQETGEQKYLEEAQRLRKRLYLPFLIVYFLKGGKREEVYLPSTLSLQIVQKLSKLTFSNRDELVDKFNEEIRYTHEIGFQLEK